MPDRARSRLGLNRTSVRLSLQFAFLYAILSAVMFFGAYWMTDFEVRDWIEDQMRSDAVALERVFDANGAVILTDRVAVLSAFSFDNERIYQLRGPDGEHLAGNVIEIDQAAGRDFLPVTAVDAGALPDPEVSGYWIRFDQIGPYTLIQGTGDHVIAEVMEALSIALVAGYILVISAGLIIGTSVGIRTERRIRRIMETLENVSRGALADRIPAAQRGTDDLSRVSGAVNATLDQLQALLESQKQIATDIAHDLRTPLQRLRQRLERMIEGRSDDEDLQAALAETENLIETFKALLRIAQIESGTQHEHFVPLDLATIVRDVTEIYQPVAEDEGQVLITSVPRNPVQIQGDPALLGQLLANLIENAIRHCPPGATFHVTLENGSNNAVLSIADDGPGIPADEAEKVFRRFYRIDKSRTFEGHGLGLPLVKAICRLHDARIALSDNAPGLKVCVTFPKDGGA
ncbi:sensor histidine kinase [Roseovarius sp. ZX-A-9]|uniref:sensor histidine kinase n=1 Tax=Roseovarius sp. ZX-A-9 TaxID=3014783 RepID=UPI002330D482|nr:HAMP domain-containing sensor histidine kinase [Roseovarius sp. ZX-A-9]